MSELAREFGRKAFHMLSLGYLGVYHLVGYPRVLPWMAAWLGVVTLGESGRLLFPGLGRGLTRAFSGIMREGEKRSFSGIFHTTAGCLAVMVMAGGKPSIVAAAVFYLSFGDAVASLVGKAFGRRRIPGTRKSFEGSAACFAVCLGVGLACGFAPPAALAGAAAATLIEALPTTAFFNDNLWLPAGSAAVLLLVKAS